MKTILAMLNCGKYILIFIYLIFQTSCSKEKKFENYVVNNFNKYDKIHKILSDSINYYLVNKLDEYAYANNHAWRIDSFICINNKSNLLVSVILHSNGKSNIGATDLSRMILGKKINKQWYFFQGSTLIVPRDMYGKDEYHPLSFHELSQIARKEMFGENCLIKKDGEWIVNDEWVEYFFYNNGVCGHCKTKEQFDSAHWSAIQDKWKHKIDTTEIKKQTDNYN